MFSVRKAKKADLPIIEEMFSLLFPNAKFRKLDDDIYLIAEKDGQQIAVGFCHFRMRERSCYIAGLGVLPQYREHGIGTMLMSEALRRADKKGVETTTLKVRALNHASSLYLQFGFFEKISGDTLTLVRKRPS